MDRGEELDVSYKVTQSKKKNFFFKLAQDLNIHGWSGRRTCGEDSRTGMNDEVLEGGYRSRVKSTDRIDFD